MGSAPALGVVDNRCSSAEIVLWSRSSAIQPLTRVSASVARNISTTGNRVPVSIDLVDSWIYVAHTGRSGSGASRAPWLWRCWRKWIIDETAGLFAMTPSFVRTLSKGGTLGYVTAVMGMPNVMGRLCFVCGCAVEALVRRNLNLEGLRVTNLDK